MTASPAVGEPTEARVRNQKAVVSGQRSVVRRARAVFFALPVEVGRPAGNDSGAGSVTRVRPRRPGQPQRASVRGAAACGSLAEAQEVKERAMMPDSMLVRPEHIATAMSELAEQGPLKAFRALREQEPALAAFVEDQLVGLAGRATLSGTPGKL